MREPSDSSNWLRLRRFATRYSRSIWIVALTIFAAVFVVRARGDLAQAVDALADSSPLWISVILAAQVAGLLLTAATYQALLRHTGNGVSLRRLVAIHLQRKVVGTIVPAGGPASVYVYVRDTARHGVSSDDALFTVGLRSVLGYASFISLLIPVMLLTRPDGMLLAGALALVTGFSLVIGLVLLLLQRPQSLGWIVGRLPARLSAMLQHMRSHRTRLGDVGAPFVLALLGQLASVVTLAAAMYALGYTPSVVTVLAGYTVGTAAVTLAPAFQGIGIVEVSMAMTLQQFGVPAEIAIAATLLYRGATVWFPLLLGALSHAGSSLPVPAVTWRFKRPVTFPSLQAETVYKAVATPVVLAAMLVTLAGSGTPHSPVDIDTLRDRESSIHLTAY